MFVCLGGKGGISVSLGDPATDVGKRSAIEGFSVWAHIQDPMYIHSPKRILQDFFPPQKLFSPYFVMQTNTFTIKAGGLATIGECLTLPAIINRLSWGARRKFLLGVSWILVLFLNGFTYSVCVGGGVKQTNPSTTIPLRCLSRHFSLMLKTHTTPQL